MSDVMMLLYFLVILGGGVWEQVSQSRERAQIVRYLRADFRLGVSELTMGPSIFVSNPPWVTVRILRMRLSERMAREMPWLRSGERLPEDPTDYRLIPEFVGLAVSRLK